LLLTHFVFIKNKIASKANICNIAINTQKASFIFPANKK